MSHVDFVKWSYYWLSNYLTCCQSDIEPSKKNGWTTTNWPSRIKIHLPFAVICILRLNWRMIIIIKPLFYSSWLVFSMAKQKKKNWRRTNANSGNNLKTRPEKHWASNSSFSSGFCSELLKKTANSQNIKFLITWADPKVEISRYHLFVVYRRKCKPSRGVRTRFWRKTAREVNFVSQWRHKWMRRDSTTHLFER